MSNQNKGKDFINTAKTLAKDCNYNPQTSLFPNEFDYDNNDFEVFLFVNYDICNFTRYKRNNKNWIELLQQFVFSGVNYLSPEYSMQFWKFNGDSLTYKKRIQSIHEICEFLNKSYIQLKHFQNILNNLTTDRIYIRGGIWISGFQNKNNTSENVANNITFQKQQFGQEFVGENIDEGFRLSECAKSSNLVVDPKIVYILSIYTRILEENNEICPIGFSKSDFELFLEDKIKKMEQNDVGKARTILKKTIEKLFLMEFQKCKGVWNDRAYPIFWYIDDLTEKEFVYDDIVDGKVLLAHSINKYDENNKNDFENGRNKIIDICAQVGVIDTIKTLLMNLIFFPNTALSGEYVFDNGKLYYMIACTLVKHGKKEGVLIFKRSDKRHHLKNVWDLIPIKHARVKTKNNISFIETYLKKMLIKELCINEKTDDTYIQNDNQPLIQSRNISFDMDKKRDSVKPWSLCNIYRNGEVHNGILCVANIDIGDKDLNKVINFIKQNISTNSKKYTDVKFVKYKDVEMCNDNNEYDLFQVDNIKIRTLKLQEISDNSDSVLYNHTYASNFEKIEDENEYGIAYLGYSIKQIMEDTC